MTLENNSYLQTITWQLKIQSRRVYRLRIREPVVMVGIGFLVAYLLSRSGIVQTLELATYDLRLWLRGPRPPPPSPTPSGKSPKLVVQPPTPPHTRCVLAPVKQTR